VALPMRSHSAIAHVIAQRTGQLLHAERVLADQLELGRIQECWVHSRPDAGKSLIGLNLDYRAAADALYGHRSWIPRSFHLAGFP
jgi:hypothetical protein